MNAAEILGNLEAVGGRPFLKGNKFLYRADQPLGADLVREINRHKPGLVEVMKQREDDRSGLLPDSLKDHLKPHQEGRVFAALRGTDKTALDAGAGLSPWTGIPRKEAGDIDLADMVWSRARKDPARWRAVYDSLQQAHFEITVTPGAGQTARALVWIFSTCQAAREVAQDLGLIQAREGDQLQEGFRRFKIAFHATR